MRKRILILCDKSPRTSFGRISESFLRALKSEYDTQILWLGCRKDFPQGMPAEGLSVWSPTRETGRITFPNQVARVLKRTTPDWILLIRPELGFLVPRLRKVVPQAKLSLMVHDTFAETLYPNSRKFKLINRYWIRGCDQVDGFLFNSHYTWNEARKVFQIHGAQSLCGCVVDPQDFFKPANASELRRKWNFAESDRIALNVSLDEPRKNLQTFYSLAQKFPQVKFVRIGPCSPWITEFLQQNKNTNVLHFHGLPLESLREFYALADVLIFPSLLEGFGYPPLESLSCGTPVISSNTSAMAEILPGCAELIDDPQNLDLWSKALTRTLAQGKRIQPQAAIVLQQFGPSAFAEKVSTHVRELIPV